MTRQQVLALIEHYGLHGEERDQVLDLWKLASQPSWWYPYRDIVGERYAGLIDLEDDASLIRNYGSVVHGLLQTETYARALIESGPQELTQDEIDRRVEVRRRRQAVLEKEEAPRLWVILDEAALHREVGGPGAMREQLGKLLEMSRQPSITVQVIPFKIGAHPAPAGAMTLFDLSDGSRMSFMETVVGDLYLEQAQEIEAAEIAFNHLNGAAVDRVASAKLIEQRLKEY